VFPKFYSNHSLGICTSEHTSNLTNITIAKMKVILVLFAAAAAVMAQSSDTVVATASGVCEPHGDHWSVVPLLHLPNQHANPPPRHCPSGVPEPTAAPALSAARSTPGSSITSSASHTEDDEHDHDHAVSASACEPHGDHWHCPSGVPEPTAKPEALSSTCSPHGDHWHCPSGVAEPATPPAASTTRANAGAAGASNSASATPTTGGAGRVGKRVGVVVGGALGAMLL
jgi:hypothetical protein